jgi:hypothetical protein
MSTVSSGGADNTFTALISPSDEYIDLRLDDSPVSTIYSQAVSISFAELSISIDSRVANISRALDLAGFGLERHVLHGSDARYFSGVLNLLDGDLLFSQSLTLLSADGDIDLILKIKEIIRSSLVMHSDLSEFSYDLRRIDDDDLVKLSSLLGFSFSLPLWLFDKLCNSMDDLLAISRLICAIKSLYLILRISRLSDFGKRVNTPLARSRLAELSEKVRKHSLALKEGKTFRRYINVLGKS